MSAQNPPPGPRRGPRQPRGPAGAAAAAAAAAATKQSGATTIKRFIWTGAFAAVTIVGALYGAGLKTQQEYKAERQQVIEYTPEERIRDLEARRAALVMQKRPFEKKIGELQARIKANSAKAAEEGK